MEIYIDFTGKKNDIPLYNFDKSIIYLDTGTDILIKVLLNNYDYNGQEIELINIYDFCIYNDDLLIAYPYRKKDIFLHKILNEKNNYINDIIYEKYLIDNIIIKYYESYSYYINDNNNSNIILNYDKNEYLDIILHLYYEINSKSNIRKYKRISKYFNNLNEYINIKKKIINIIEEICLNNHTIINEIIELYNDECIRIYYNNINYYLDINNSIVNYIVKTFYNDFIKIIII